MANPIIRHAGPPDADTIGRLVHALLDELSGGQARPLHEITKTANRVLADQRVLALLAEAESEAVGGMLLFDSTAIYAGGDFGTISELYVAPSHRSQGVAPMLLAAARDAAGARNWSRLEVGAPHQPQWHRTLAFYLKNGFEEVGPRLRLPL